MVINANTHPEVVALFGITVEQLETADVKSITLPIGTFPAYRLGGCYTEHVQNKYTGCKTYDLYTVQVAVEINGEYPLFDFRVHKGKIDRVSF